MDFSLIFSKYWNLHEISVNLLIFANIVGALFLGMIVGYERSYHGRAAGMRTYGLVCMASCALVVFVGYPTLWYGGELAKITTGLPVDPTRVVQGVVTGIGFLGAGVIVKDGLNISGLTTAASIWASSAIGVLVGVGFYAAAILLTILSASLMMWASKLEEILPSRPALSMRIIFKKGFKPKMETLERVAKERGYILAKGSFHITTGKDGQEWKFIAIENSKEEGKGIADLSAELVDFEGVETFEIAQARN